MYYKNYLTVIAQTFFIGSIFTPSIGMETQEKSLSTTGRLIKDISSQITFVCLPSVQDGLKEYGGMKECAELLKESRQPTLQEIKKRKKEQLDQINRSKLKTKLFRLAGLLEQYTNAYPSASDYKKSRADEIIKIEKYFTSLPPQHQLSAYAEKESFTSSLKELATRFKQNNYIKKRNKFLQFAYVVMISYFLYRWLK